MSTDKSQASDQRADVDGFGRQKFDGEPPGVELGGNADLIRLVPDYYSESGELLHGLTRAHGSPGRIEDDAIAWVELAQAGAAAVVGLGEATGDAGLNVFEANRVHPAMRLSHRRAR